MPTVSLQAHFDGERILLDEPFDLPVNSPLLVTVLLTEAASAERKEWFDAAAIAFSRCYGDDEPDYGDAKIIR